MLEVGKVANNAQNVVREVTEHSVRFGPPMCLLDFSPFEIGVPHQHFVQLRAPTAGKSHEEDLWQADERLFSHLKNQSHEMRGITIAKPSLGKLLESVSCLL